MILPLILVINFLPSSPPSLLSHSWHLPLLLLIFRTFILSPNLTSEAEEREWKQVACFSSCPLPLQCISTCSFRSFFHPSFHSFLILLAWERIPSANLEGTFNPSSLSPFHWLAHSLTFPVFGSHWQQANKSGSNDGREAGRKGGSGGSTSNSGHGTPETVRRRKLSRRLSSFGSLPNISLIRRKSSTNSSTKSNSSQKSVEGATGGTEKSSGDVQTPLTPKTPTSKSFGFGRQNSNSSTTSTTSQLASYNNGVRSGGGGGGNHHHLAKKSSSVDTPGAQTSSCPFVTIPILITRNLNCRSLIFLHFDTKFLNFRNQWTSPPSFQWSLQKPQLFFLFFTLHKERAFGCRAVDCKQYNWNQWTGRRWNGRIEKSGHQRDRHHFPDGRLQTAGSWPQMYHSVKRCLTLDTDPVLIQYRPRYTLY